MLAFPVAADDTRSRVCAIEVFIFAAPTTGGCARARNLMTVSNLETVNGDEMPYLAGSAFVALQRPS